MSAKKKGLGLGTNTGLGKRLQALGLAEQQAETTGHAAGAPIDIDVTQIVTNPNQPRQTFDEEALSELASSLQQYGLIQPIVVRRASHGQYELIAGERRLRAAKQCQMKTIPALIRDYSSQVATEIALIENLQREDLNAIEEGRAYAQLIETFGLTQDEAAKKVGKSRSHVANMMRLLKLAEPVQEAISQQLLTMGQARPLLQLAPEQQIALAQRIIDEDLSARQVERLAKAMENPKPAPKPAEADAYLESLADRMKMHFGTAVAIHVGKKNKGKIEISFTSEAELERLLAMLTEGDDVDTPSVSTFHV